MVSMPVWQLPESQRSEANVGAAGIHSQDTLPLATEPVLPAKVFLEINPPALESPYLSMAHLRGKILLGGEKS